MRQAYNLPANIDFSQCDEVNLIGCDLSQQTNLRFKDGAKVNLHRAENLPANLDFSPCDEVDLDLCDLSAVKKLIFKNRQQMKKSHAILPDRWKGKLVFADSLDHQWGKLVVKMFGKGER